MKPLRGREGLSYSYDHVEAAFELRKRVSEVPLRNNKFPSLIIPISAFGHK